MSEFRGGFLSAYEKETLDSEAQESLISLIFRARRELQAEKGKSAMSGPDYDALHSEQVTRDRAAENDRIREQKRRIRLYGTE